MEHTPGPVSVMMTCAGCDALRLCREYEGIWLCLRRTWKCWKNRKTILASKKEDK